MDTTIEQVIEEYFPQFEGALKEEIIKWGYLKKFDPNVQIMDVGQTISNIPLIYEGNVKIFREDEDGNELFLYYLESGESCAISMVCSGRERISKIKAVAIETSYAIMIPLEYMDAWMQQYKSWYYFVLETYQHRMDELLYSIDNIAFKKMDERLLAYLRKNAEAQNSWELNTNHQTIATELNSSREVISRLLKKLEQRGAIKVSRNKITIIDLFV